MIVVAVPLGHVLVGASKASKHGASSVSILCGFSITTPDRALSS